MVLGLLLITGFPPGAWGVEPNAPVLTWQRPVLDTSTLNLQPQVLIRVFDNDGNLDWNRAVLSLNGQVMTNWKTSTEEMLQRRDNRSDTVKFTPDRQLAEDSIATVSFSIYDQAGNIASGTWQVSISSYRDMRLGMADSVYPSDDPALISANTKACTSCHKDNNVLQQNHARCANCHGNNLYPPKSTLLTNQSSSCIYCHYGKQFTNGYAHSNAINSGTIGKPPQHPYQGQIGIHTGSPADNCTVCHSRVLTREHVRRTDPTGAELRCATCHNTTAAARVQMAVANQNTSCGACHDGAAHEEKHTTGLDANCQTCHRATLSLEHLQNPATQTGTLTCDTCHTSTVLKVRMAIAGDGTYCGSCHTQGHDLKILDKVPEDIPLMPGLTWAAPEEAALWAGEAWLPDAFANGGQVVTSQRRQGLVAREVYQYYLQELEAKGWVTMDPLPGAEDLVFKMDFSKPNKKLLLWFYGGPDHNGEPLLPEGNRVELIYTVETNQ